MTTTEASSSSRGSNVGNALFAAAVGAILVVFLTAVALVLLSNVKYLAEPQNWSMLGDANVKSGWQFFVEGLKDPENHFAIKLSVLMAALTALLSMIVAIPAAYALSRFRIPGSSVIDTLLDLPIVVPPPVIGLSLLIFFRTDLGHALNNLTPQWYVDGMNWALSKFLGQPIQDDKVWVYSTRGIVVAQFFVACSFGVRAVKATFDTIGPRYEDVARTLGCSRAQAFFKVVVPMARTGVVAGLVMTWARAVAEFGPVLFFSGATPYKTEVMPIAMFLRYSAGRIEPAVVLLLIMLMISTVTLLTFKRLGGRGYLW